MDSEQNGEAFLRTYERSLARALFHLLLGTRRADTGERTKESKRRTFLPPPTRYCNWRGCRAGQISGATAGPAMYVVDMTFCIASYKYRQPISGNRSQMLFCVFFYILPLI